MDGSTLLAIGAPLIAIAVVWIAPRLRPVESGTPETPGSTDAADANELVDAGEVPDRSDADDTSERPLDARRLLTVLAVTAAIYGPIAIVRLAVADGGFFTLVRLLYLAAVVATPIAIVGSAVAFGFGRGLSRSGRVVVALSVVAAAVGVYATHVEPEWLRVDRVEVRAEMSTAETIRVGVLADIQTASVGSYERDAVDRVLDADPDIILIAGDVFQGSEERFDVEVAGFADLMSRLSAPHGVYAVEGNVDRVAWLTEMAAGTEVQVVVDEIVELDVRGQPVRIGGSRDDWQSEASTTMRDELARSDPGDLAILVAHRPDAVLGLPAGSGVDLTVSGHTHGGQVVVPLSGPLVTFTDVPRSAARGGLHDVGGNRIYVSTGVGLERAGAPKVRFLNRPSVAILEFTAR